MLARRPRQSLSLEIDGSHILPKRKEIKRQANIMNVVYGRSVQSAQMLEVSLLGVGTVLRLERDAW